MTPCTTCGATVRFQVRHNLTRSAIRTILIYQDVCALCGRAEETWQDPDGSRHKEVRPGRGICVTLGPEGYDFHLLADIGGVKGVLDLLMGGEKPHVAVWFTLKDADEDWYPVFVQGNPDYVY